MSTVPSQTVSQTTSPIFRAIETLQGSLSCGADYVIAAEPLDPRHQALPLAQSQAVDPMPTFEEVSNG